MERMARMALQARMELTVKTAQMVRMVLLQS